MRSVIITDRGKPSHVLMTNNDFRRLARDPPRRNEADALIAATALVHNMTVVSGNIADFEGTGVIVVDPWQD